ncbi:hypothetical protein [Bacillus pseudomycoides]|uniref:Ribosomal protein L7/L12 C-terminal domain-containing protein n=1 Tax=Bacillus pseudomycoides TaxID=64104 RepID=A0A2A8C1L7_9BACI|nr:hypothetical protein [Bacillus pseudomycoides]PDY45983.1 hypothetical protein CON79_17265 [Bacillus pseudomycoides]PEA83435.1 hypothetical protein CON99_11490 [Bacillus pseudomycoides]PED07884.1 hypothetical protein COO19_13040 [Bacillus pseudomycoides]PED69031.1 hypothetical protein CON97_27715 [Bacillus pseudomycoides]PEI36828.1 hypothetical protein CN620_23795 [Bacillus pseudomycoides]
MGFWVVLPIVAFGVIYIGEKIKQIEKRTDARLKRMETRLELMTKQMGIREVEPEINNELRQLVKDGKTITAVKKAREAFGYSLLEAKEYVDSL